MPAQERLLRELLDSHACPKLYNAVQGSGGDLSYEQLLGHLQSFPLTDYSGDFEASCRALLDAMRAGEDAELIKSLAAGLCDQVPQDWGMTSGTTGSSKYFPLTAKSMQQSIYCTGKDHTEVHLRKFPLQPYRPPSGGSSSNGSSAPEGEVQQAWRHRSLSLALAGPCEELKGGHFVGSISSVLMCKFSKLGIVTERDAEGRELPCRPVRLMYEMAKPGVEAAARYYALWLCAAAEPGLDRVTFFTDLFAGNMLTAINILQHHWQELVQDLNAGKMACSHAQGLPAVAADIINQHLAQCSPAVLAASAQHIQQAMTAHEAAGAGAQQEPLLGRLMPNLHAVLVVLTGSHSKFWPSLRRLIPQHVPVCTPWHAGTEGLYGITKQLVEPGPFDTSLSPTEQQYAMMPHGSAFFEYLPVNSTQHAAANGLTALGPPSSAAAVAGVCQPGQAAGHSPECAAQHADKQQQEQEHKQQQGPLALTMDQLEVGQDYELVVTTFAGLTRYRVGDVVRVDGFMPFDTCVCMAAQPGADPANVVQLPLVSFKGRVGVVLNLVWEKYDEGQLLQAVRDTVHALVDHHHHQQQQQAGAAFPGLAEFTVFEDTSDESNKHYSFLWELAASSSSSSTDNTAVTNGDAAAAAIAAVSLPDDAAAAADVAPTPAQVGAAAVSGTVSAATVAPSNEALSRWGAVLNKHLAQHNTVYAGLLAVRQAGPATISCVAPGSFKALKEVQVAAKGISPSQFKMPTVVAPGSSYARFLQERVLV